MKKCAIGVFMLFLALGFSMPFGSLAGADQSHTIILADNSGWNGPPCDNCDPDDCNKPGREGEMNGQS